MNFKFLFANARFKHYIVQFLIFIAGFIGRHYLPMLLHSLVLPFFGPSNLRDTARIATDAMVFSTVDPLNFNNNTGLEVPYYSLKAVGTRKRIPFQYYGTGNPFEYELIRFLYTKKREVEIIY